MVARSVRISSRVAARRHLDGGRGRPVARCATSPAWLRRGVVHRAAMAGAVTCFAVSTRPRRQQAVLQEIADPRPRSPGRLGRNSSRDRGAARHRQRRRAHGERGVARRGSATVSGVASQRGRDADRPGATPPTVAGRRTAQPAAVLENPRCLGAPGFRQVKVTLAKSAAPAARHHRGQCQQCARHLAHRAVASPASSITRSRSTRPRGGDGQSRVSQGRRRDIGEYAREHAKWE